MARTEQDITAEINAVRQAHHDNANRTDADGRKTNATLKGLQVELQALLLEGVDKKCPRCGATPMVLHKNPVTYEIGCVNCTGMRVRGHSHKEAVATWNENVAKVAEEVIAKLGPVSRAAASGESVVEVTPAPAV